MLDIDECGATPCSQICTNSDGSFECSCQDGYQIQDDGRSCAGKPACLHHNHSLIGLTHKQISMNVYKLLLVALIYVKIQILNVQTLKDRSCVFVSLDMR